MPTTSSSIWLLVDGDLPLERPAPLVLLSIGCVAVLASFCGLPIAPTARACPAAGRPLSWRFSVGVAWYPGSIPRASAGTMQFYYENLYVSLVLLILGRDDRGADCAAPCCESAPRAARAAFTIPSPAIRQASRRPAS